MRRWVEKTGKQEEPKVIVRFELEELQTESRNLMGRLDFVGMLMILG